MSGLPNKDAQPSVSEILADWIEALKPNDIPTATREKARDILVDIIGLCMAARNEDYVLAIKAASEPGDHIIIGHTDKVSASSAALINGTAAHGEDFDDTFEGGPVHSGVVIVPAILAAAQAHNLSNERIMFGIAVGTEVLCRLALTLPKAVHKAGFHPTAVLGAFAATAGICAACGSDRKTTANALGIVGSMASGIIEYLGDGSWTKRMHPGWAAQSALRAFNMAAAGFIGPRYVFEGAHGAFRAFAHTIEPKTEELIDDLGARYVMDTITFKPFPCGTMVQPYIDCAVRLGQRNVPTDNISRIICKTAEGIVHRLWEPIDLKQKPPTSYAAKFSVPFGVALGLVRHQAALEDFTTASINDPELLSIASKVDFEIDPDNPYPAAFTGHIRIEYADGTIIEEEQDHMRGGAKEPLTRQEINDKFRANVRFGQITDTESILDVCDRIAAGDDDTTLLREFAQT